MLHLNTLILWAVNSHINELSGEIILLCMHAILGVWGKAFSLDYYRYN